MDIESQFKIWRKTVSTIIQDIRRCSVENVNDNLNNAEDEILGILEEAESEFIRVLKEEV